MIPYTNKFHYRHDIYGHAKKLGFTIDEYKVTVNGAQLFKEYKTRLYEGADNARKIYDDVFGVEFKDFYDGKTLIAWAWYGLCRFEKAIPKALNPMYGFRLRQGNIQIGDNTAVASLFKEDRGNSYFIGEIFTVDKNLIPNSQRNYFNETPARINLEEQLRVFFYDELHRLYHVANETKNHYRKLEAYNDAVAKLQENPSFDKVGITTLFTFYWDITIDTINFVKQLCKDEKDVMVGGIMSTLLPEEVYQATGIHPFIGLLNHPGDIDEGDTTIIDALPLDYSILDEIEYKYPANNAYFAYMTRGCINHCTFCAVPTLEPTYCDYIGLKEQINIARERFGEQRDLLLLDNNVLASKCYDKIIDEIKECGFGKGATYIPPNQYEIAIRNLRDGFNDRAYIRKCVVLYKALIDRLHLV